MNFIHQQRTSQVLSSIFARTQKDSEVLVHLSHGLFKPSVQTEWIDWPMKNNPPTPYPSFHSHYPPIFLKQEKRWSYGRGTIPKTLNGWICVEEKKEKKKKEWYFCAKLWVIFLDLVPSFSSFFLGYFHFPAPVSISTIHLFSNSNSQSFSVPMVQQWLIDDRISNKNFSCSKYTRKYQQ